MRRKTITVVLTVTVTFGMLFCNPVNANAFSLADFRRRPLSPVSHNILSIVSKLTKPDPSRSTPGRPSPGTPSPGTFSPGPSPTTPAPAPQKPTVPQFKPAPGLTKEVVGFYVENWEGDTASLNSVKAYGNKMAGVASFSYKLNADGSYSGKAPAAGIAQVRENGGKAVALIHNFAGGSFDRNLIHTVLASAELRTKAVQNILSIIEINGFDGVNIDLENIAPNDRELFTQFISEMSDTLHDKGYMVTICVPAKTYDEKTGWGGAFDYKAIGSLVDRIMLMAYDEHWFGGPPGAVASIGWVEDVVKFAISQVPAEKILLGLGMYGYDWEVNTGKSIRSLSTKKALQVAAQNGSNFNWDNTAKVPYFYYSKDGVQRIVWFESSNSAAFKMDLVNRYNLAGIAIWELGYEDDSFWQIVSRKFAK